jgi:hypothetical protein
MKMKKLFNLFIFTTLAPFLFGGVDVRIEGAFGVRLGDTYQVNDKLIQRTREFEFTPVSSSDIFQTYHVKLTPKSRKIYSISAEGYVQNEIVYEKMDSLRYELAKKYLVPNLRLDTITSIMNRTNRLYVEEAILTDGGSITLSYPHSPTRGILNEPRAHLTAYSEGNKCVMEVVDVALFKLSIQEDEELRKLQNDS